jgi:putative ABC transport system permease protein
MLADLRYAIRSLRAAPVFATVAVVTLAVGIAVNTIAFTLLEALALRPMPVRDPARVVRISAISRDGKPLNLVSYPDFLAYRDRSGDVLAGVAAYIPFEVTVGRGGRDADVRAALAYAVSSSYLPLLGIEPALGRSFTPAEESAGAERVAIVSYRTWQVRYAASPGVLGQEVTIDGRRFTIVGVGPERFMGTEPLAPDFWMPLPAASIGEAGTSALTDRRLAWLLVIGRLKPGIGRAVAEPAVNAIARRLGVEDPGPGRPAGATVDAATFFSVDRQLASVIALVMGTVALVLVIACANTANLALARATARRRELAVRLALGAGRGTLVRHLLAESLAIGLAGGALGLLLSSWTLRVLYPIGLSLLPFQWATVVVDFSPDANVYGYALAVSLLTAVAFGLVPALQSSTPALAAALRDEGSVLGIRLDRSALRNALVIVQMSVCLMLLAAAGLAARSLGHAQSLDLGFQPAGVVYTDADLRRQGYSRPAAVDFHRRLLERTERLPGVEMAALASHVPLRGGVVRVTVRVDGADDRNIACRFVAVTPNYFELLRIPLVRGRAFTAAEADDDLPVAIVSEGLAARLWPEGSPIGRRVLVPGGRVPLTIVGIARDATATAIWRDKEIAVYVPSSRTWLGFNLHVFARTSGDAAGVARAIRAEAQAADPDLLLAAAPLESALQIWILPSQVAAVASGILGGLALLLAGVGLYAVVAHAVSQRTREVGIRVALGATRADVLRLVLRDGGRLVAAGIGVGLAGAFATTRLLAGGLVGVSPLDPVAMAGATVFLSLVALLACYVPARRAARVEPMTALRS